MSDNEGLPPGEHLPEGAEHAPLSSGEIMTLLMLDEYRKKLGLGETEEVSEQQLTIAKAAGEVAIAAGMCVMDMVDSEKPVNFAKIVDGDESDATAVVLVGAPDPHLVQAVEAMYHAFNMPRDTAKG